MLPSALPPLANEDLDFVLRETADLWKTFPGRRILITGATGLFGIWLLETLIAASRRKSLNLRIFATSRDPMRFKQRLPHLKDASEIKWITGNLTVLDAQAVSAQVGEDFRVDCAIHLITESDPQVLRTTPVTAIETIVESTRAALKLAVAGGAKRFLFTSSGSVYGSQPAALPRLAETYLGAPFTTDLSTANGLGGNAKRQAELLCVAYGQQFELQTVIARCFSFLGPHLPLEGKFAAGNFLRDVRSGRDIIIKGDGTAVRSYLYAGESTVWLLQLLMRGVAGSVYNVGSENAVSIRELAERIAAVSGKKIRVQVLGKPSGTKPIDRYVPSTGRIREELELKEKITLEDGIARSLKWLGDVPN